jgi:hypothetical protein
MAVFMKQTQDCFVSFGGHSVYSFLFTPKSAAASFPRNMEAGVFEHH